MSASGVSSTTAGVMNMLANNAEGDVEKTAKLMKKAMKMDADMVSKLLPLPGSPGSLDIQA